jgi:ADP-ribose pyrophosphatase YjhB (NUDIX family)
MKKMFPLVMVDIALFAVIEKQLCVLLLRRANAPGAGQWALPGGILMPETDHDLEDTARRVLSTKINVHASDLKQVATFSGPQRDPRGWSVSTLFYALLPHELVPAVAGHKTEAIAWSNAWAPEYSLVFDHALMLRAAVTKLHNKVEQQALPLHLMSAKFTLTELQETCEAILGHRLDKSSFRRRIKNDPRLLILTGDFLCGSQRPAQLYSAA